MNQETRILSETIGILDLKIARIEKYLEVLEQQQALGGHYPDYKAGLAVKRLHIEDQLQQLLQHRYIKVQNYDLVLWEASPTAV